LLLFWVENSKNFLFFLTEEAKTASPLHETTDPPPQSEASDAPRPASVPPAPPERTLDGSTYYFYANGKKPHRREKNLLWETGLGTRQKPTPGKTFQKTIRTSLSLKKP